jgi:hypothetical protein
VVRFQIKLFETTNVIELHYCTHTAASPTRASGVRATVGIENATGISGVRHSYNMGGSIGTASAIRYTP